MKKFALSFIIILFAIFQLLAASTHPDEIEKKIIVKKDHLKMGVILSNIPKNIQKKMDMDKGAYVVKVLENSPAEKAGLKKGDILIQINDKEITSPSDVLETIENIEDGQKIKVAIVRNGKEKELTVELKEFDYDEGIEFPDMKEFKFKIEKVMPRIKEAISSLKGVTKGGYLGVEVEGLTDQLMEFFGVDHGVLIKKVIKGSPAEKAGLKAGDIIVQMAEKKIMDYEDVVRVVNFYDPGDEITVVVVRNKKQKKFKVTLGKKPHIKIWNEDMEHKLKTMDKYMDFDILEKLPDELEHLKELEIIVL